MRKADYALLAHLLREKIYHAKLFKMEDMVLQFEAIAYQFATLASVDRAKFLKACGIE